MTKTPKRPVEREDDDDEEGSFRVRLPDAISFRDILYIVGIIVTIAIAWFNFGTRVALIEQNATFQNKTLERLENAQKDLDNANKELGNQVKDHNAQLDKRIQEDENTIDSLWRELRRSSAPLHSR